MRGASIWIYPSLHEAKVRAGGEKAHDDVAQLEKKVAPTQKLDGLHGDGAPSPQTSHRRPSNAGKAICSSEIAHVASNSVK